MRISAKFTPAKPVQVPPPEAGFSLIEILVALAVLSLAVGVATSATPGQIGRSERAATLKLARLVVQDARHQANLSGRSVELEAHAADFAAASGLTGFAVITDVSVSPGGLCRGGPMMVTHNTIEVRAELADMTCEVTFR